MVRYLLKHADYVSVRDVNTLETLRQIGVDTESVHKTNELVFLFPQESVGINPIQGLAYPEKPTLGITFHHIYYRKFMTKDTYVHHMRRFVDGVIEQHGFNVVFISMESAKEGKGDISLLMEIREQLEFPEQVTIANVSMDPRDLLGLFASLNFLVATKTHSVVYGLRMGIPTLAIAYARKTSDFMLDFDQSSFNIPLERFDPNDALERFSRLVAQKDTAKVRLDESIKRIQAQAQENINAIAELLRD